MTTLRIFPQAFLRRAVGVACLMVLGLPPVTCHAGKVSVWRHSSSSDFEKGQAEGVVVDGEGNLRLSRQVREVADLDCASVWDLLPLEEGRLLAGTAIPGRVIQLNPDATTNVVWKSDDEQVFSLARLPDGRVLIGTGPKGRIHRIEADGHSSVFFEPEAQYVWDLAVDADGNTYAATGPEGRIYKIKPDGTGTVFYQARQPHVLVLALGPEREVYAGTDADGLVLKISPAGKARVIYDAAEDEVHAIRLDAEGVVYAATASGGQKTMIHDSSAASAKKQSGENHVYRIDPTGAVRGVFHAKARIYDLAQVGPETEKTWLASTGPEGVMYAFDSAGLRQCQSARLDTEVLLALCSDQEGGLWIATGNPGKVYRLSAGYRSSGTFTSAPLDAKLVARFGSIVWRAEVPDATQVSVSARSGNTDKPDATWSTWCVEQTDPAAAKAGCPTGRFFQYRLTLATTRPEQTPTVRSIAASYLTTNQAPRLTKLVVPHVEDLDGKKSADKLKLDWAASDANGDTLRYSVRFRKANWKSWVVLKKDLTAEELTWDAGSVPEGVYRVKITVSDRLSNPAETALEATRVSEPFIVDNRSPQLSAQLVRLDGNSMATIDVAVEDAMTPIARASYSIDSQPWVNLFPDDGLFDAPKEKFRFKAQPLSTGTHVIVVRATDAAGHTGSTDLVFESSRPRAVVNGKGSP